MKITFRMTGVEALRARLRGLELRSDGVPLEVVQSIGREVVSTVAVRSGELRAAWQRATESPETAGAVSRIVCDNDHAAFVEYGTVRMAPHGDVRAAIAKVELPSLLE